MFLPNKYSKWYEMLVAKRRLNVPIGYSEIHHIVPKSLGGTNRKDNLVRLTAREHFIAHRLLVRMVEGDARRKMVFALHVTLRAGRNKAEKYLPSSRTYARVRAQYSASLQGVPRNAETREKISSTLTGRQLSEAHRQNIGLGQLGTTRSEDFKREVSKRTRDPERDDMRRKAISASLKGRARSEETRRKISETRKRKSKDGTLRTRWSEIQL